MGIDFLKNFKNPWEATGEKVRNSGVLRNVVDEWAEKNQAWGKTMLQLKKM